MKAGSFLASHLTSTNKFYALSHKMLLDNFSTIIFSINFVILLKSREAKLSLASCSIIIVYVECLTSTGADLSLALRQSSKNSSIMSQHFCAYFAVETWREEGHEL